MGRLKRRHLVAVEHVVTGKETNQVFEEIGEESDGVLGYADAQVLGRYGLGQAITAHGVQSVTEAIARIDLASISDDSLYRIVKGHHAKLSLARSVLRGLDACVHQRLTAVKNDCYHSATPCTYK